LGVLVERLVVIYVIVFRDRARPIAADARNALAVHVAVVADAPVESRVGAVGAVGVVFCVTVIVDA